MLSFLFAKKEKQDEDLSDIYASLKNLYSYSDIDEERKTYLKQIEESFFEAISEE